MRKAAGCGKSGQFLLLLRGQFQHGFGTSQRHTQGYPNSATIASYFWDTTLELYFSIEGMSKVKYNLPDLL
jgi:hypothetical protein